MPQTQTVKCHFCKKEIDKSTAFKVGDRTYYCDAKCKKNQEDKQKYKPSKDSNNPDVIARRKFTDKVQSIYLANGYKDDGDIPWQLLMSQTKNMMQENKDFKYTGMTATLDYMINIEDLNLFDENSNGSILSLLPFYYSKAKQFWLEKHLINKAISEQGDDFMNDECVYINSCNSGKNRLKSIINIEEL